MSARRFAGVVTLVVCGLAPAATQRPSSDWPQWRGVNRDGAATFAAPAAWPEALNLKWKVEVGLGYSAPIIVGDRVCVDGSPQYRRYRTPPL